MILLIDNYDSFSYNLYQLVSFFRLDTEVFRNDKITLDEIARTEPEAIILSPGPGRPENAGICVELVRRFAPKAPILGVCLGHQAICQAFGAEITYAKELMHGKVSAVNADADTVLFSGMKSPFKGARYHSLAVNEETLPSCLKVTARSDDGEVMAVQHETYPVFGVQFHPESVMTPDGKRIMGNFLSVIRSEK